MNKKGSENLDDLSLSFPQEIRRSHQGAIWVKSKGREGGRKVVTYLLRSGNGSRGEEWGASGGEQRMRS